jgi:hypothetical protein
LSSWSRTKDGAATIGLARSAPRKPTQAIASWLRSAPSHV